MLETGFHLQGARMCDRNEDSGRSRDSTHRRYHGGGPDEFMNDIVHGGVFPLLMCFYCDLMDSVVT